MPRYGLKKLLAALMVCSTVIAFAQSAGYLVTIGVAIFLFVLVWTIRSRWHGWMVLPRVALGILSFVAIWFLAIDWSWFVWYCEDCRSSEYICHYRIMGIEIHRDFHEEDLYPSVYQKTLLDLGVPCRHAKSGTWHKHRWWGLSVCAAPCWNEYSGIIRLGDWYADTIWEGIRERGRSDPNFAALAHRKTVVEGDFDFLWVALLHDKIVVDSIKRGESRDAARWIAESSESNPHWIGDPNQLGDSTLLLEQIQGAGGKMVLVLHREEEDMVRDSGSYYYPREWENFFLDNLPKDKTKYPQHLVPLQIDRATQIAIELPTEPTDRQRLFVWATKFSNLVGGRPIKDYGQDYLLFDLY